MIAIAEPKKRKPTISTRRADFLAMLPTIKRRARFAFRRLDPEARADMIAEVVAAAYVIYHRLVEAGKADLIYATPLANVGIKRAMSGRKVGSKMNVRDIGSRHCQAAQCIRVERLDRFSKDGSQWQELLVEDRHAGPDAVASIRIDFAEWLEALPDRKRRIAALLATGECTCEAAKRFNLSSGRISQLRGEFKASWESFQGEVQSATAVA